MASQLCSRIPRPSRAPLDTIISTALSRHVPIHPVRAFSATTSQQYPRKSVKKGDRNKMRGVSAIRATGLRKRQTLSVRIEDLAVPAEDNEMEKVEVDPRHGLWEFFNPERTALTVPEVSAEHGRAWTFEELARKNWEDLHALWWVCLKERNRISTDNYERERLSKLEEIELYGGVESRDREMAVKQTMKTIKKVLTKRWYAWEDARNAVAQGRDPEVRFDTESGKVEYTPSVMDANEYIEDPDNGAAAAEGEQPAPQTKDLEVVGEVEMKGSNEASPGSEKEPSVTDEDDASRRVDQRGEANLSATEEANVERLDPFLNKGEAKGSEGAAGKPNRRRPTFEMDGPSKRSQPESQL